MPIYEYQCQDCGHVFSKLFRSISSSAESPIILCPDCGSDHTRRIVSSVAVLGSLGGLTPGERAAENAQYEKQSKILSKEKIDQFRAAKKK